jgi:hypothetical protein
MYTLEYNTLQHLSKPEYEVSLVKTINVKNKKEGHKYLSFQCTHVLIVFY